MPPTVSVAAQLVFGIGPVILETRRRNLAKKAFNPFMEHKRTLDV